MTKKETIKNAFTETMTMKALTEAVENLPFNVKISTSKKDKNVVNIYDATGKTKYFTVTIVAPAEKKAKKAKKTTKTAEKKDYKNKNAELYATCDSVPVKEVGNGYVVVYKMKGNDEIKTNDEMTTCAEIKAFIKKLHKEGKVALLNIYKMGMNYFNDNADVHKTRISAWVGIA